MTDADLLQPFLHDAAFLADVAAAPDETDACHVWWLGQSGFLVKWRGRHLLFDPYLSDSLTRKYAATDKPHVRMTARVVAPERLGFVDVATSTHNHTDHLDGETLGPLFSANSDLRLILPEANRPFAADRLGLDADDARLVGLDAGETTTVAGYTFTGVPAAHETLERDEAGRHRFLGYVVSFGPWTLYHSGDTLWYDGMENILSEFEIDLALLPINGRMPERRVAGNLDGEQAARLAHAIGAGLVVPCHYDMFTFNTASPDAFVAAAERLGQPYRILRNGERLTLKN